jgi:hypothetical protein
MLYFLKETFRQTAKNKALLATVYATNLGLALALVVPFYRMLVQESNGSLEINSLLEGFNYTTFSEFIHFHKNEIMVFVAPAFWLGLAYYLLQLFFSGGIIFRFTRPNESFVIADFLRNSLKTFGSYFLLSVYSILLFLCVFFASGIFFFVSSLVAEGGTERAFIFWMIIPVFILFLAIATVAVMMNYAKVAIFKNSTISTWSAFLKGIGYVFRNYKKTMGYFLLIFVTSILAALLYLLINKIIGTASGITIFIVFLFQQVLIFVRLFTRIWQLATAVAYLEIVPIGDKSPIEEPESPTPSA